jgi:hypothetical protein
MKVISSPFLPVERFSRPSPRIAPGSAKRRRFAHQIIKGRAAAALRQLDDIHCTVQPTDSDVRPTARWLSK